MAKTNVKIIGLSGKVGSGKSFVAEHISRETGIRLVKLDYQAAQAASKPVLRQLLQRKLKLKIPKAHEDIQLFPLMKNMEKNFSKLEFALFRMFLNRKVKKLIRKSKESLIIDFVALPILKIAKNFDEMYVTKSDENMRFEKLGARDNMSVEEAKRVDKLVEPYYKYNDAFSFADVIEINYQYLPKNVDEIITNIKKSVG